MIHQTIHADPLLSHAARIVSGDLAGIRSCDRADYRRAAHDALAGDDADLAALIAEDNAHDNERRLDEDASGFRDGFLFGDELELTRGGLA
jgi:hypothetical protein